MIYTAEQEALRPLLGPANISPDSFLATDYLNHFNEIVMTLEMAVDMPELMEDAQEWKPLTYAQHFEQSGFADKELVIEAYEMAPVSIRDSFEETVDRLNHMVMVSLKFLDEALKNEIGLNEPQILDLANKRALMHDLLAQLNGLIHSGGKEPEPSMCEDVEGDASDAQDAQDAIDQLFD